jgi:hypothetical protein
MNGFRLDRRRDAMRGGTIAVIGPGNSDGSRLYHRLIGNTYGPQMPPTGALGAEQIRIIKDWDRPGRGMAGCRVRRDAGETPRRPVHPADGRRISR